MVQVHEDTTFYNPNGVAHKGYYFDQYLKENIDNFVIKAVQSSWDYCILITGIEGCGKSTATFSFAKYVDPTFPGEPLNDGTPRRSCNRIVFTPQQFMDAVDNSKPGQAIVWDEFVLGGLSTDAMSSMQKLIVSKMVTLRKKRLYLFLVIPSIFLLRKYFSVFRTKALLHFYTPDGIKRGYFKAYNYDTKHKLVVRGLKEWNQNVVRAEFAGRTTNTEGYFFDVKEYDTKKEEAIVNLTTEPQRKKKEVSDRYKKITIERNKVIAKLYEKLLNEHEGKYTYMDFCKYLKDNLGMEYSTTRFGNLLRETMKDINIESG